MSGFESSRQKLWTEQDKAAWGIVNRIWALSHSYQESNYPFSRPPNLYVGQEEYRYLRLAEDYLLRCQWYTPTTTQVEFMGMPLFVVNTKNHLSMGGIDG